MRNNEPQSKTTTVEFERELDNKDITEVELTGCHGQGGGRAQMAAGFEVICACNWGTFGMENACLFVPSSMPLNKPSSSL